VPTLMLDFDGVLHHAQGCQVPDFSLAPKLAAALAEYQCDVVISSTWREHHPLERLRNFLPSDLGARVVDVLGPDNRGTHVRYQNIMAWIHNQRRPVNWRALDDVASEFPLACPELILCHGSIGLAEEQCQALQLWLSSGA
jgi:hypothetical protein